MPSKIHRGMTPRTLWSDEPDVIDQLDDRALIGRLGDRSDVFGRLLDQLDRVVSGVVDDDVVDHEREVNWRGVSSA